jgi:hypothetical protein
MDDQHSPVALIEPPLYHHHAVPRYGSSLDKSFPDAVRKADSYIATQVEIWGQVDSGRYLEARL